MIITKQRLQQLVNEEFSLALGKRQADAMGASPRKKQLSEAPDYEMAGGLYEVEVSELLDFAKAYAGLGNAVQDQLDEILDNADNDSVNPNAIDLIEKRLGGINEEIDNAIASYKEMQTGLPAGHKRGEDF